MAATKSRKKAAKKAAAKKRPARKSSQRKIQTEVVLEAHPFAPGQTVQIHPEHAVGIEKNEQRAPAPKPVKTAKVNRQGRIIVRGLERGRYSLCAELEEVQHAPHSQPYTLWKYVSLTVS